jgi:hypothetical protein
LSVALLKFAIELGESTKLGGADGSKISGVREDDGPFVANKLVEVNGAIGGLSFEVWGDAAEAETGRLILVVVQE